MAAWTTGVVSGDVRADYSQIELHPGLGGHVFGMGNIGLANGEFGPHATLTTPRQFGDIHVTVQALDEKPVLDPSWDAAVEFTIHTGESVSVTGWAGEGTVAVPVPVMVDVRVRYIVIGAQIGWDQPDVPDGEVAPERYLVQVWPEARQARQAPQVVASTSPWSQYWTFGAPANALLAELADWPDPDRLTVVIDRALAAHPVVAARIRAGDNGYQAGVIRYVQELFRITYTSGAYDDMRDDHERLGRLIDERAHRGSR